MSINNNINNFNENNNNILTNDNLEELISNGLNDIEQRTKILSIKDIEIKENIRSIKLKEKKIDKLNQTILNKKEELKLIKELFLLKEEQNMNIQNILDSYLDFLLSSNDNLDNKLNSLFQKEININSKQKVINKLLGEDKNENDYDYIYENINRPIDISKFYLKPTKRKNNKNYIDNRITENGGDNLDKNFIYEINNNINNANISDNIKNISNFKNTYNMNNVNNINYINSMNNMNNVNNVYLSKKNKISSSSSYEKISNGIKLEELPYNNSKYKINDKIINNYDNTNIIKNDSLKQINPSSSKKYDKFISPKNLKAYSIKNKNKIQSIPKPVYNNNKNDNIKNESDRMFNIPTQNEKNKTYRNEQLNNKSHLNIIKETKNFARTDTNDFNFYNLKPNNKLKKAREIFKRLLDSLKNANEFYFSNDVNNNIKKFFLSVLKAKYFLRKILFILYECSEIYNPNNKRTITETIHDSEFISRLYNIDSDVDNENEDINNIRMYEKGLEEIKKITQETKQLQDKISKFAYEININE